jgi:hypothetical protein
MIDREARDKAARLLDRFIRCEITNFQYADNFPRTSQDRVLEAMFWWTWGLYSDVKEHKLEGRHRLDPRTMESLNRCLLFLRSDLEYEWPDNPWTTLSGMFLSLLTLGFLARRWQEREFERRGEIDMWPFLRQDDCLRVKERLVSVGP